MQTPVLFDSFAVAADTEILPAFMPVPGMGVLAVNAFVIRSEQPVLVDTGLGGLGEAFVDQLASTLDLDDLRWIWITHADPDHVGALGKLLARAPRAKVVTTYLGMGKLGMIESIGPIGPERFHLLNPGQELDVGDRTLRAVKPPTYDAPETTGAFDTRTGAWFCSDSFGALLQSPASSASEIDSAELAEGAVTWATVDSPWLHGTSADVLDRGLERIARLDPSIVLSAHLPPARNMLDELMGYTRVARTATPFVGPDQTALLRMLSAVA